MYLSATRTCTCNRSTLPVEVKRQIIVHPQKTRNIKMVGSSVSRIEGHPLPGKCSSYKCTGVHVLKGGNSVIGQFRAKKIPSFAVAHSVAYFLYYSYYSYYTYIIHITILFILFIFSSYITLFRKIFEVALSPQYFLKIWFWMYSFADGILLLDLFDWKVPLSNQKEIRKIRV